MPCGPPRVAAVRVWAWINVHVDCRKIEILEGGADCG